MRELKRTCLSDVRFQTCIAKCFNSYGDSTAKPLPKNAKNSTSGWGAFVKNVSLSLHTPYGYGLRTYSWLPFEPRANSNQNQFPLDFRHTFSLILPSVTRTLDNSNLPLTRSNFCFPSDHFYIILFSITRTMFWALKKFDKNSVLASETLNFEFPIDVLQA